MLGGFANFLLFTQSAKVTVVCRVILQLFSLLYCYEKKTNQSKGGDDVLLAVHGQASQQLPLHTAFVGQLFQGRLWVLSLGPLFPTANQELFLGCNKDGRNFYILTQMGQDE